MSIDASTADAPSSTTPSVAIFSPGRTTNRSPDGELLDRDPDLPTRRRPQHGDVLGAQLEQRTQRGAGAALGAGLEVAAGEEERGDAGGDLEVEGPAPSDGATVSANGWVIPGSPALPKSSAHSDQANAASTPIETRVSIVAAPWRRFAHAARWNGQAPQTTTGAARVSEIHCQ